MNYRVDPEVGIKVETGARASVLSGELVENFVNVLWYCIDNYDFEVYGLVKGGESNRVKIYCPGFDVVIACLDNWFEVRFIGQKNVYYAERRGNGIVFGIYGWSCLHRLDGIDVGWVQREINRIFRKALYSKL